MYIILPPDATLCVIKSDKTEAVQHKHLLAEEQTVLCEGARAACERNNIHLLYEKKKYKTVQFCLEKLNNKTLVDY